MSNVVSLDDFKRRKKEDKAYEANSGSKEAVEVYFREVIERNQQVRERLKEQRKNHNKKQIKDYDLK